MAYKYTDVQISLHIVVVSHYNDYLDQGFLNLPACRHRSAFRILMSARKIVATFLKKLLQTFFVEKLLQKFEITSSIALAVATFLAMFVATFLTIFIATFL